MRKLFLGCLALMLSVSTVSAQEGSDALKEAGKAITAYQVDKDAMKLQQAVDMIEVALRDSEVASDYKSYLEAGDIYASAVNAYVENRILTQEATPPAVKNAAATAAEMYMKAFNMSEKKGGRKSALSGLEDLQGNLSNEGIYAIQDGRYDDSYASFSTSLKVDEFLNANAGESNFGETQRDDETYYAALSAVSTENNEAAEPLLMSLYESGYEEAAVYDNLYKLYTNKGDKETAVKYLTEGREKFPDASSLLFTEINYYLAENKLDELTGKLDEAIAKEPNNVSLYATLGSVYDKLYQLQTKEGNEEKAGEYFELAKTNYDKGLEIEPKNASLIYSTGALYFNRAANKTQELVALGDDYSKEGQKKYEALKAQVDEEFRIALPFFQKAEKTDPSNINTLIALKEIYARMDDFETSTEFKNRMEQVNAGEKIEKSYFEEKGM